MSYAAVTVAVFALYLVAPTFLIIGGRLALAGSAMLFAALVPVFIAWVGHIDNAALALMTMLMLPLPLLVLCFAAVGEVAGRLRKSC